MCSANRWLPILLLCSLYLGLAQGRSMYTHTTSFHGLDKWISLRFLIQVQCHVYVYVYASANWMTSVSVSAADLNLFSLPSSLVWWRRKDLSYHNHNLNHNHRQHKHQPSGFVLGHAAASGGGGGAFQTRRSRHKRGSVITPSSSSSSPSSSGFLQEIETAIVTNKGDGIESLVEQLTSASQMNENASMTGTDTTESTSTSSATSAATTNENENEGSEASESGSEQSNVNINVNVSVNTGAVKNNSTSVLHTFHYPPANITLHGLSVSSPQFQSWVEYKVQSLRLSQQFKDKNKIPTNIDPTHYLSQKEIDTTDDAVRVELRRHWFERRLISDRTEVLTVYPSNGILAASSSSGSSSSAATSTAKGTGTVRRWKKNKKRGGFEDMLSVYTDRLLGLIQDEMQESSSNFNVRAWLRSEYGEEETEKLSYQNFGKLNAKDQIRQMQHFLNWFRGRFPYYYDKCDACGASYRNDENHAESDSNSNNDDDGDDKEDEDSVLHGSFLGYCYPEEHEVSGKASRTEMYRCHVCGEYTRFPRFNSVSHIVEKGKGRCGEYSILLFRLLRSLGLQSRWVVDWADHVWAEYLGADGRWVHVDPCEASIDHPLLYEEWGKKQTFIVAFYTPLVEVGFDDHNNPKEKSMMMMNNGDSRLKKTLLVEDVTTKYTSASKYEINRRREEHADTTVPIRKAEARLRSFLSDMK